MFCYFRVISGAKVDYLFRLQAKEASQDLQRDFTGHVHIAISRENLANQMKTYLQASVFAIPHKKVASKTNKSLYSKKTNMVYD